KQRALLKQNAPFFGGTPGAAFTVLSDLRAHDLDLSASRRDEPDDGAHQYGLAAARSADQPENLAAAHVERQVVDHDLPPETDHQILHPYSEWRHFLLHRHIPIDAKNTAKRPSRTITRNIDFTTEVVVCLPSDSALPFTRNPSLQAMMPIASAMN